MATITQQIESLIESIVSDMRQQITIISEALNAKGNVVLTVDSITDLENGDFLEIGTDKIKIRTINTAAGPPIVYTIELEHKTLTGASTALYCEPFLHKGTPKLMNKYLNNISDSKRKYPGIFLFMTFRETQLFDPLNVIGLVPRITMAFLEQSSIDWDIDTHIDDAISPMIDLKDEFLQRLQANKYIGKFNDVEVDTTKIANFGKQIQDEGADSYILNHNLSGVVIEFDLPVKKRFFKCSIDDINIRAKCSPGLIVDQAGNLIQTLGPGEKYEVITPTNDITSLLVFDAASSDVIENTSIDANLAGDYTTEILSNVDTIQYEIDTGSGYSVATLPFTLAAGNGFKVTITRLGVGESTVQIEGTY